MFVFEKKKQKLFFIFNSLKDTTIGIVDKHEPTMHPNVVRNWIVNSTGAVFGEMTKERNVYFLKHTHIYII